MDPKPVGSDISGYAVFRNNPIVFVDSGGDTTYVYNIRGQYAYTILNNDRANEIVFLQYDNLKQIMNLQGNASENERAGMARDPSIAYAIINEKTIESLNTIGMSSGFRERGGLLIIDSKTKVVTAYRCIECESETSPNGEVKGNAYLNRVDLGKVNIPGKILGGWHDHNLGDSYGYTQPTDEGNGRINVDFNGLTTIKPYGGIGLINNNSSITIFPLSTQSLTNDAAPPASHMFKNSNSVMNQNPGTSGKNYDSKFRYGVFNKKGLGVKPWR